VLASEEVMTHTPFVAWPGWGCYGGGYDRASALGGTLAVIAPVRRKRKSREGESIGRPRCATQRRVRGGGLVGAVDHRARGAAEGAQVSGAHQVWPGKEMVVCGPRWMVGYWANHFGPGPMNNTTFYLFKKKSK
jgi:hypothetical protein